MKKQVFISYSLNDKTQADAVCYQLESANIECWIAPRDISPSKDWAEEIIDAINAVDVMVLIFSSSSNESPQVRREIERAVHKGVDILPFRIEDVIPSKSLEYFISTQHWLDACTGDFDKHLDELYQCIKVLLSGETIGSGKSAPAPMSAPANKTEISKPLFAASELKYVSVHLANYLGPMAKVLVNKKAAESKSLSELVQLLSKELDDSKERNHFVQSCMSIVDGAPT